MPLPTDLLTALSWAPRTRSSPRVKPTEAWPNRWLTIKLPNLFGEATCPRCHASFQASQAFA
jgi:hypothetical protein